MGVQSTLKSLFVDIPLARYLFVLKAKEEIVLPPYKGSTLRGGFGITFRKICCVKKENINCIGCLLRDKCAYAYVFETSPPQDSQRLRNLTEIPRPFVIEPPSETKRIYKEGETLEFGLVLVGKAIDYLPYFIFTFKELGNVGIGKYRRKFKLVRCLNYKDETIYDSENEILRDDNSRIGIENKISTFSSKFGCFAVTFLTPTRIKIKGDLITKPEFYILIKFLLHRISALTYFHCQKVPDFDYKYLISEAKRVTIKRENVRWIDWERYSSRQDTRMKLGGFVGKIIYEGSIREFLPLLLLGEYTHLGKNCTFGLGKYEFRR